MKVLVLTGSARAHGTQRLATTFRRLGHEVLVADPHHFAMRLSRRRPELFLARRPVTGVGLVVPRFAPAEALPGLAVLRQLEHLGIPSLNGSEAIARTRDKLTAHQHLLQHDICVPPTAFVNRVEEVRFAIDLIGGAPVVVKALEGHQAGGVMLAETVDSAVSLIEALTGVQRPAIVQKFVGEAAGIDVRAFVVGGNVVAAMRRRAPEGDVRAGASGAASLEPVSLIPEARRVAVAAASALGLDVAGIDMMETPSGPLLLDVSACPGFEGLESVTGIDVASVMARHALGRVSAQARAGWA